MSARRTILQGIRQPTETAIMGRAPSVVVLDEEDELARIQTLVTRLGVDSVRWQGDSDEAPPQPRDLLVTTGAKALKMDPAEDSASETDEPVWLCVHNEDFFPLRDRLRERGVHYLVQMTTDEEALRLLLQQILYRGTDRREASRLPMDCQVDVEFSDGEKSHARLLELSCEGCRFECGRVLERDTSPFHRDSPLARRSRARDFRPRDSNGVATQWQGCNRDAAGRARVRRARPAGGDHPRRPDRHACHPARSDSRARSRRLRRWERHSELGRVGNDRRPPPPPAPPVSAPRRNHPGARRYGSLTA